MVAVRGQIGFAPAICSKLAVMEPPPEDDELTTCVIVGIL